MAQTLLQLVNQAQAELGVSVSATVIGNTARPVVQMLNLINGVGQDLMREYQWQSLTKRYQFQTVYYQYTGDTTLDSTTLSNLSDTTGLTANPTYFMVSGPGIQTDSSLVSVSAPNAVISMAATATGTTVDLLFSQVVYDLPSDFDRVIDDTEWDKTDHWQLLGPSTAQQWEYLRSGWIATGPRAIFRLLNDKFTIWPSQDQALYFGFEYVSNLWVRATGAGTALSKTAFAVDTDTSCFPDRLLIDGLKLRFAQANQRPDWQAYQQVWDRQLSISKANDAGSPTLNMSGRKPSLLIDERNIPDTNYGM